MSQGQGRHTVRKQGGLAALFRMDLRISRGRKCRDWPYYHLDLNAGCGWNKKVDCPGSPLTFLEVTQDVDRSGPIWARFCDHNADYVKELKGHLAFAVESLSDGSSLGVVCQDNGLFLQEMAWQIRQEQQHRQLRPEWAIGTLLCDPNGEKDMPLGQLRLFAAEFPRIDLILNINCNLFRKFEGCKREDNHLSPRQKESFRKKPTVREIIASLGRKHWYIRNPPPGRVGSESFCLLFGQTMSRHGGKCFKDFFPVESRQGQDILNNLRHIVPEQRLLWED